MRILATTAADVINVYYYFLALVHAGKVMFSYCLCVCLSAWDTPFETVDMETTFLVWWYTLTISRPSLNMKVTGSRSCTENAIWTSV